MGISHDGAVDYATMMAKNNWLGFTMGMLVGLKFFVGSWVSKLVVTSTYIYMHTYLYIYEHLAKNPSMQKKKCMHGLETKMYT